MLRRLILAFVLVLLPLSLFADAPVQGGALPVPLPLFPGNNWWNIDVSNAPVDLNASTYLNYIGLTKGMHPDFGGDAADPGYIYGFPFVVVDGAQAKKTVSFIDEDVRTECDGVDHDTNTSIPFYPIPDEAITTSAWIEAGPPGNVDLRNTSDRHLLIVDKTNNTLYELYNVWYNGTAWEAYSGAFFDMNANGRRTDGWTSADAAGLAILPGLVRYDEVYGPDEIRHAFRFTVRSTNGYVYPASHNAGSTTDAPPMGLRLRLKADKNISGFNPQMQKIFRAMKKYGLIVADNGTDMYVSGTYDTRWNNDILNPAFGALKVSDFEVVQLGWSPSIAFVLTLPAAMGNGDAASATVTAYNGSTTVATGYTGTVHFTSTDGAATLPVDYTFTPGDAGTHTFPAGITLRTVGSHVVTVTDTVNATMTGSRGVTVGPPTPTGLVATATSTTQVTLTWNASAGATQYEVVRGTSAPVVTASASYTDNSVTAGNAYVYTVRALDASARRSPYSAPDVATTILFTDDPLLASTTLVKGVHITELRQAANALRTAAGLPAATFTDASLPGVAAKAVHIQELRTALAPARATLGLTTIVYTDPTLTAGTTLVKAAHVQELRNAVK
jgi:hypothetical protein